MLVFVPGNVASPVMYVVFCVHFSGVCVWLHLMRFVFSLLICDWDV